MQGTHTAGPNSRDTLLQFGSTPSENTVVLAASASLILSCMRCEAFITTTYGEQLRRTVPAK